MLKKSIIFLLTLLPSWLGAQTKRIDSLKNKLELSSKEDTTHFDILYQLSYQYSGSEDSISLIYATQAYDLSWKLGDSSRIIKSGRIKSAELRRLERFDESIPIAERVLLIAKRHKNIREINFLLTSLAVSHTLKAQYDKALKYNFESLVIRENEGDKRGMSVSLNNIGLIYYKLQDFKRALEYYQRSLKAKNEVNDHYDLDRLLINIGLCYNYLGEYDESIDFVNQGFSSCEGQCKDEIVLEGETALGIAFLESDHIDESIEHFTKSNDVAKRIKNFRFQAENLIFFAKAYYKKNDFELSKKYLSEAESIAKSKGYRFLLENTYKIFSDLYEKTGDYKNQSDYQSKYIKLRDSILNEKVISNLSQIRTEYQERENIKTIAEKNQDISLQKEVITRQQRQVFFISIIACLIGVLAYLLFYFNKRQQKSNQEISSAKNKIEEQNLKLADHNKQLEEEVDRRTIDLALSNKALQKLNDELDYFIYKSSHDIRGPLLTLKGMCNIALRDLKDPVAIDYFKKFDVTTDKLNVILSRLQIVNYISHSPLKPVAINFKNIIDEIIEFERKKGIPDNMSFNYVLENDCTIISDEFLVRTILENMIDNAVKFRNTSGSVVPFVKMNLKREGRFLRIVVNDNGIGIGKEYAHDMFKMFIRASEQSEIGGVGLYLIKLAIDRAGGEITLLESSEEGSTFQALLPTDINDIIDSRMLSEKKLVEILEKQT